MAVPIIRRYTRAAPSALNSFDNATDEETSQAFTRISRPNVIKDVVNDPDPAAGLSYAIQIAKEGIPTGRNLSSTFMSPNSAGRVAVGPIDISPANYYYRVAQRAGALAAFSFAVKYAGSL